MESLVMLARMLYWIGACANLYSLIVKDASGFPFSKYLNARGFKW